MNPANAVFHALNRAVEPRRYFRCGCRIERGRTWTLILWDERDYFDLTDEQWAMVQEGHDPHEMGLEPRDA